MQFILYILERGFDHHTRNVSVVRKPMFVVQFRRGQAIGKHFVVQKECQPPAFGSGYIAKHFQVEKRPEAHTSEWWYSDSGMTSMSFCPLSLVNIVPAQYVVYPSINIFKEMQIISSNKLN